MKEFIFTIEYESGVDHLMDVFIEYPELRARTLACHATKETMWRLDEVTGSSQALSAYDDRLAGLTHCSLTGMGGCKIDWTHETLSTEETRRLIYSRQSGSDESWSIPYLAAKHFGDGVLCQVEQHRHEYHWRFLVDDDAVISPVYDELDRNLRDELTLIFDRVSRSAEWSSAQQTESALSDEQRATVELAVGYGYYETPRQASVQEIAEAEGIPTSTLQYRLTSAEAALAKSFLSGQRDTLESAPLPISEAQS